MELLLKKPLTFEKWIGRDATGDPIWWFRGSSNLWVENFERIDETRCLLNWGELEIDKVAVFRSDSYYRSFVYVETKADEPVGIYDISEEDIERMVEVHGYAYEEYGLFDGIPITVQCYDDGAAVIEGEVVDVSEAKLRVRYLSRYNLIITSKFSPLNQTQFDKFFEKSLDDILEGKKALEELIEPIEKLPRNPQDM